jgi:hypothetical protein
MKHTNLFGFTGIALALSLGFAGCESPVDNADIRLDGNGARSANSINAPMYGTATVSDVDVIGFSGSPITAEDVLITLDGNNFTDIDPDTDLSAWFTNLPSGLQAISASGTSAGDEQITITISETPDVGSAQVMAITIPGDYLLDDEPITVDTNSDAKYDIIQIINDLTDFTTFTRAVRLRDYAQSAILAADIVAPPNFAYIPIALADAYYGVFDGGGYSITYQLDLHVNFLGLFARNNGTIKNLTVAGTINLPTYDYDIDYVGGVVGYNDIDGHVENVVSQVTVNVTAQSAHNIGGIAGFNGWDEYNTVSPHYGEAYQTGGYIYRCRNEGAVTGAYNKIGGIAGENAWSIIECSNYGTITCIKDTDGWPGVGGIAGRNGNNSIASEVGQILNCYNRGLILDDSTRSLSHDAYSGIAGWCNDLSSVTNCYDTGDLEQTKLPISGDKAPIIGEMDKLATGTNNYSLDTVYPEYRENLPRTGIRKAEAELKDPAFIALIGNAYVAVPNDYPKLGWE